MPWSPDVYARALGFAARAHGTQTVPGVAKLPYVVHVCTVCAELLSALRADSGLDEDLAVACALLHDVLEDTDTTAAELEAAFGPRVLAGVCALTKDAAVPRSEQMADSLRRIRAQPREVWLVKLADRTTNMQPPPEHWTADKCRAYQAEARTILEALGAASPTLAARLAARIEAYPVRAG